MTLKMSLIFSVVVKPLKFFSKLSKFITNDSEKLKRQSLLMVSDHLQKRRKRNRKESKKKGKERKGKERKEKERKGKKKQNV